jgi:hypothetical protein
VVADTFAADTFALTRFIGAVAFLQIFLLVGALWHLSSLLAFDPLIDRLVVKKRNRLRFIFSPSPGGRGVLKE